MRRTYRLVLDLGTTKIKALVFDQHFTVIAKAAEFLPVYRPKRGWVEQKPEDLIDISVKVMRAAVRMSKIPLERFIGLGITNQRETSIVWDRTTGKPIYNAIVWQDERTRSFCKRLSPQAKALISSRTGLAADPYFSASKIKWIVDHSPNAFSPAREHRLLCGTVDTWLTWNLCKNHPHVTDYTNASRTLLLNIKTHGWDQKLLKLFDIQREWLPKVMNSHAHFGVLDKSILGAELPVRALCGDQQSSMYATLVHEHEAGKKAIGTTKITYGTGTFVMQIIGARSLRHKPFFMTLVPGLRGPLPEIEGKIGCCGGKVTPLLNKPKQLQPLLRTLAKKVQMQIRALPMKPREIVVDGGVSQSEYLLDYQSSLLNIPLKKHKIYDGTALGTAYLIK